ncbi:hypothetical protein FJY93_05265 [Candidatus Kaiserbacteria bacterium]|nr:hypothetical protein [Candidatus Kaiserbacteria bacterium]
MDNLIARLYQSPKTILTTKDIALLWQETNPANLKSKISYYAGRGALVRLTRGVFAKDKKYDPRELATSLYAPSYISFETALREAGVIFQHYDTVFAAGPWSLTKTIDGHAFTFRKLKDTVLFNPAGVRNENNYSIATPERAFLDMLYLFPRSHFDNLGPIDWTKCRELAHIYGNKQLAARLVAYEKKYAQ